MERLEFMNLLKEKQNEHLAELTTYIEYICRLEENTDYLEKLVNMCKKKHKKLKHKIIKKISKKII